jgi:hypothetical protein
MTNTMDSTAVGMNMDQPIDAMMKNNLNDLEYRNDKCLPIYRGA